MNLSETLRAQLAAALASRFRPYVMTEEERAKRFADAINRLVRK